MKKKCTLFISFCALCLIGISCSKTDDYVGQKGEEITVSLNLTGDFDINVDQNPLTKDGSSSTDVYGINVYYDKGGDGTADDPYAYGLFDDVSNLTIILPSSHKYKVCCTLVKDARNTLHSESYYYSDKEYDAYFYPFQNYTIVEEYPENNYEDITPLYNKFIISNSTYFSGFGSGDAYLASSKWWSDDPTSYASINRFYGESDQFEPVSGEAIDVYLKRVIFGAKFVVSGLQEGTASVTCGSFFSKSYTTDDEGTENIYTFPDVYDTWKNETPLVDTVSVSYTDNSGGFCLSQSQEIKFKRNVMTTVNIKLNPSGFIFNLSEEEYGEDNIIDMGIDADGQFGIIENPEN